MKNESEKTESEFFIRKRELGQLFDSNNPLKVDLFRGQKPDHRGDPILYPILKAYLLSNGKERPKDITTYLKSGELWVNSSKGGVSLYDVVGNPVKSWDYYKITAGTKIPAGIVIFKDSSKIQAKDAKGNAIPAHYSIRPNWDMPLTKFLFKLDDLASKLTKEQ